MMFYVQAKKYKELRKREEQIEDYLAKHETLVAEEKEAKGIHEENVVKLLEATSTGFWYGLHYKYKIRTNWAIPSFCVFVYHYFVWLFLYLKKQFYLWHVAGKGIKCSLSYIFKHFTLPLGLSRAKMLPSVRDYKELKDDLEFKATEADRAKDTLTTLETDKTKLRSDFQKLEQLETKINTEMVGLLFKVLVMVK